MPVELIAIQEYAAQKAHSKSGLKNRGDHKYRQQGCVFWQDTKAISCLSTSEYSHGSQTKKGW